MGYEALGTRHQPKIFFEGNSLFSHNKNISGSNEDMYIPRATYAGLTTSLLPVYYPISGQTQTQINSNLTTKVLLYSQKGDVVVLWEGTNDMHVNGLSGADAYANLITYRNKVIGRGLKLVVATTIARDYATDAADLMDRIDDYNTLIRANTDQFTAVCDLAANSLFDTRADASNTTYYHTDKLHLITAGQDAIKDLLITSVQAIL